MAPVDEGDDAVGGRVLAAQISIPEHSMCEDLLGSCAENHVVCLQSVRE
jgi:hypothetical protein